MVANSFRIIFFIVFLWLNLSVFDYALALSTDGTIDSTYKYAWSENIGWINFGCTGCNVHITNSEITGYAWSANYGWINLNPSTSGVKNDGNGNLSGYAWGENIGWINFSGVTIDSDGYFHGYANGTVTGQISFNCANTFSCSSSDFKVRTDWRPFNDEDASNDPGLGGVPIAPSIGAGFCDANTDSVIGDYVIDETGINFLTYLNSRISFFIGKGTRLFVANIVGLDIKDKKVDVRFTGGDDVLITLKVGQRKAIDLDNDGYNDIIVTFNELQVNRVDLTFKAIGNSCERFKEGDLVKESGKSAVYLIEEGRKRPIFNAETFEARGFNWRDIKEVEDLSSCLLGKMIGPDKKEENQTEKAVKQDTNNRDSKKTLCFYSFNHLLRLGDKGEDVKKLQKFLNQNGFILSQEGPGSPGSETDFFGALTKKALINFQEYYKEDILYPIGLRKGTGVFGPATIKFVNSYCQKSSQKEEEKVTKNILNDIPSSFVFKRYLSYGARGNDVKYLQTILSDFPDIYPEKIVSGYFGDLTKRAVIRFQLNFKIIKDANEDGAGRVGPLTIKKLNELLKKR